MPAFCGIISHREGDWTDAIGKMSKALSHRGKSLSPPLVEKTFAFSQLGRELDESVLLTDGEMVSDFDQEGFWENLPASFAFAHYDRSSKEITLARDHFGTKPLYYAKAGDLFLFASELKALLLSGLFTPHPDLEAISAYLSLGYIPLDKTPILEVRRLRPGHRLHLDADGDLSIHGYFSYSEELSRKENQWSLNTFNEKAGPSPTDLLPKTEFDPETLPQLVWYLDEPIGSTEALGFFQTCQSLPSSKEVISSLGSFTHLQESIGIPKLKAPSLQKFYRHLLHGLFLSPPMRLFKSPAYFAILRSFATHKWHTHYLLSQFSIDPRLIRRLTKGAINPLNPELLFHSFPPFERMGANYSSLLYLFHKTLLSAELLPIQERLTSAHGVNLCFPYLRPQVSSYLASMPESDLKKHFKKPLKYRYKQQVNLSSFEKIFPLLKKGVLIDNGIISREGLKLMGPAALYQLLVLEVWFRLFYEKPQMLPEITTTELLQHG